VPRSIIAFLEDDRYEDVVRDAISLGGDADTMACIARGVAEASFGGVPDEIASRTVAAPDERLRGVVSEFRGRFTGRRPGRRAWHRPHAGFLQRAST
jgi:ADP-ribosylglycohydrolase